MSNKENINANKFEGPKLKMEPLQMKKKKKGGGYNLRKSLAWNRAFFTEEGVLDPDELSMISGALISSSKEGLSVINEESMNSLAEDYPFKNDSANLLALEKNLFKGSPAACSQKNSETVYLPPKHTSPARFHQASTSMASHKVLSIHGARKARSTDGASPRFLPTSSFKRPANINACKPVSEESKLPKIPVSKPRYPSLSATNKGAVSGTASSKQNKIMRPVVNKQRNTEPKSNLNSVEIPKSKAKAVPESLATKSSASHAKRNKVNPPFNMHAPTQLWSPQVKKVGNAGPKVIPDDGLPTIKVDSSEDQDVTAQPGDSLPLNNVIEGGMLQHSKIQSNQPSGLRKPSPSLGFFGRSKGPASIGFSWSAVDSNPRLEKLSDRRPPQLPAKVSQVVNSHILSANSMVSSSRYDLSAVSNISITPDVGEDARKNGKKIQHEYHYGFESDEKMMIGFTGIEEKFLHHVKDETSVSLEEDRGAEMNANKLLLVTEPCKQLTEDGNANDCILGHRASREYTGSEDSQFLCQQNFEHSAVDVTGTRIIIKSPCKEEKSSNSAVTEHDGHIESQSGDMKSSEVLNSVTLRSNWVSCMPDLHQLSSLLSDDLETSISEELSVTDVDKPFILEMGSSKKLVEYSQSSASEKNCNKIFENVELTNFELEDSHFSSEHLCASQSEDSVRRDEMTDDPHMQETLLQIPNLIVTANMCKSSLNQSVETGDLSNPSGTLLELQTAFLEVEQISKNMHELPSADCLLLEKDMDSEEYEKKLIETSKIFISEESGQSEMDNCGTEIAEVFRGLESSNMDNLSQTGDDQEHLSGGNVPVSIISHASVMCGQYAEDASCTVEFEKSEMPRCCTLVKEVPECKNKLLCLYEETTETEKSNESIVLVSGVDAVPRKSETCENEVKSSRAITNAPHAPLPPLPAQANSDDENECNGEGLCIEEIQSSCMEIQPSFEKTKLFSGSQRKHYVEFGGLLVQGDMTLPGRMNQSVRFVDDALTDESPPKVCQDMDSLIGDTNCDFVTSLCQGTDENATAEIGSKKSTRTSNEPKCMVNPPRNAVPFSDEWLAAIEAAGEDILTMKSGAVQNSPPDKPLPEPSPWSPVRRKNNAIGPYDCTKFINN